MGVLQFLAVVVVARIVFGLGVDTAGAAVTFAVYAVSVYGPSFYRLWVAGASIALILAGVVDLYLNHRLPLRDVFGVGPTALVAWVIGDYIRSRRQFFADVVARHKQEREQAAEDERLRIARELHDVVAHNVSVMAIQAGAARVSGNSNTEVLESIERSARDTLSELNKLLGVLRKTPGAPERAPQPTLDEIDAVLNSARDAGLDAKLKVVGEKRDLPAAVDLSAYRIVQEAITNVLKHANASRVEVLVDYQPDALVLTISDNGSGSREAMIASTGHGLIGMRERVEMLGGQIGAGSSSLGGFTVRARLPVTA